MILCTGDPGYTGSIIWECEDKIFVWKYPIYFTQTKVKGKIKKRTRYYLDKFGQEFPKLKGDVTFLVEDVHAMPKDGKAQLAALMYGKGLICGAATSLGWNVRFISPAAWKKRRGIPTGSGKEASIELAKQLYPQFTFSLNKYYEKGVDKIEKEQCTGLAEALLLLTTLKELLYEDTLKEEKKLAQVNKKKLAEEKKQILLEKGATKLIGSAIKNQRKGIDNG